MNSASYRISGSSGSGVAQGSLFTVFGTGLGPSPWVTANAFPLPRSPQARIVSPAIPIPEHDQGNLPLFHPVIPARNLNSEFRAIVNDKGRNTWEFHAFRP